MSFKLYAGIGVKLNKFYNWKVVTMYSYENNLVFLIIFFKEWILNYIKRLFF